MRYLMWSKADEQTEAGAPPSPEMMAAMGAFIDQATNAGVLVTTGGLPPSAAGTRITSAGGKVTLTDGPFAETKELIAGFAIVDVASKEEAIEWSSRFYAIIGDGEGYIFPMFGPES